MPPRLAIVAYPVFHVTGLAAIQAVRAAHDPQFTMIEPHFTLVFPVEAPLADIVAEARAAASAVPAFPVTLHSVRAVRDTHSTGGHVFLIPEQGAREIADLHGRLYGGLLKPALREDIPYLPHVTVAACADFLECETLARRVTFDQRDVHGSIEALTVVEIGDSRVGTVATLSLSGRP